MNCLIAVGSSITGREESKIQIQIPTYLDSITSVRHGIKDYTLYMHISGQLYSNNTLEKIYFIALYTAIRIGQTI